MTPHPEWLPALFIGLLTWLAVIDLVAEVIGDNAAKTN